MISSTGARTTIFCAVWSKDPDRHSLLRAHQETLVQQSVPVHGVYVFDDGDPPPSWLRGVAVVANRPLTIYQAWNLAVQVADTELVMNLNLDDRLALDAVARLEGAMVGTVIGGGDWRVCYNQDDADSVEPSYQAERLDFDPAWPPATGTCTRLGSGTGDRGTLGPATIWPRSLHRQVPYPWQFGSGDPIRIVGDLAWWTVAQKHLRATPIRLPMVIGNYHSHPESQAEFRSADEHEKLINEGIRAEWYPLDDVEITKERP